MNVRIFTGPVRGVYIHDNHTPFVVSLPAVSLLNPPNHGGRRPSASSGRTAYGRLIPLRCVLALTAFQVFFTVLPVFAQGPGGPQPFDPGVSESAEDPYKGMVSFDLRVGIPTGDQAFVGGILFYSINRYFALGTDVEWERGAIGTTSGQTVGHVNTVSFIPLVEFRIREDDSRWSPFVRIGGGYNLNLYNVTTTLGCPGGAASCTQTIGNTGAFRGSGGVDYDFTDHIALTGEAGWKMNRATLTATSPGGTVGKTPVDLSDLIIAIGIKFKT